MKSCPLRLQLRRECQGWKRTATCHCLYIAWLTVDGGCWWATASSRNDWQRLMLSSVVVNVRLIDCRRVQWCVSDQHNNVTYSSISRITVTQWSTRDWIRHHTHVHRGGSEARSSDVVLNSRPGQSLDVLWDQIFMALASKVQALALTAALAR